MNKTKPSVGDQIRLLWANPEYRRKQSEARKRRVALYREIYPEDYVIWKCQECGKEEIRTKWKAKKKFCSQTCYWDTMRKGKRREELARAGFDLSKMSKPQIKYLMNRDKLIAKSKIRVLRAYREDKMKVLSHYTNGSLVCNCCGEKVIQFLTVDHINGGGSHHVKRMGASNIYSWLIKHDFPKGFQILCMNCNFGKYTSKICPHKLQMTEVRTI